MKLSELIAYLQKYQQEFGDSEVDVDLSNAMIMPDGSVPQLKSVDWQCSSINTFSWKKAEEDLLSSPNPYRFKNDLNQYLNHINNVIFPKSYSPGPIDQ